MSVELVLARLARVKRIARKKWIACCPAHEDGAPSLSIHETDDGRTLLYCFAGCKTAAVIGALGLEWESLMEPLPPGVHSRPKVRRPWTLSDMVSMIDQEATILALIVSDMAKRGALPDDLKVRALLATRRLSGVRDVLAK
jgi:hypothetical protein